MSVVPGCRQDDGVVDVVVVAVVGVVSVGVVNKHDVGKIKRLNWFNVGIEKAKNSFLNLLLGCDCNNYFINLMHIR